MEVDSSGSDEREACWWQQRARGATESPGRIEFLSDAAAAGELAKFAKLPDATASTALEKLMKLPGPSMEGPDHGVEFVETNTMEI